jgi:predicted O-methyltransferase YrrM
MARAFQSDKSAFQTSRYGFFTAPFQSENSKYDFATDYVRPHAATWTKYLEQIKSRPAHGLEIGSFEGRSALWFLENILTHSESTITCVDIFESDYEKFFDKNIAISGLQSKVRKLKGDSRYVLRGLEPKAFDFAYIDGSHVAMDVLTDAVLVWDLIKPGGVIIFDDYDWPGDRNRLEGPAKLAKIAVDAFLAVYAPYIDVIHRDYQIIIKKRTSVDLDSQKHPLTTRAWRILFW